MVQIEEEWQCWHMADDDIQEANNQALGVVSVVPFERMEGKRIVCLLVQCAEPTSSPAQFP